MKFKRRAELKRTKIEIIPMIDTVLFMLVFFMLSSLAMVRVHGIHVDLPDAQTATIQKTQDVTISIDKSKCVFVNNKSVPIDELPSRLAAAFAGTDTSSSSVTINADLTVPYNIVVRCIDASRSAGIHRFVIATESGDEHADY